MQPVTFVRPPKLCHSEHRPKSCHPERHPKTSVILSIAQKAVILSEAFFSGAEGPAFHRVPQPLSLALEKWETNPPGAPGLDFETWETCQP
jgi:hypothetical protein